MNLFKKKNLFLMLIIVIAILVIVLFLLNKKINNEVDNDYVDVDDPPIHIVGDVHIYDIDGNGTNYEFIYNNETFRTVYTYDHWKIYNSYKIINEEDIKKICKALIDIHPIHGRDMVSYRTADDMSYEWIQHNIAYVVLPKDNIWRENAKDVELDPEDQGRNFKEIYENRTGQTLDIGNLLN